MKTGCVYIACHNISALYLRKKENEDVSPSLEVGLSVEGGGEGHVVEGTLYGVHAVVGLHPLDAVLGLVRGQLTTQLLRQDVGLQRKSRRLI